MTTLDKAVIAHLTLEGKKFEIYVDPELAELYKEGKKPDVKNILVVQEIFTNAKKGERAKQSDLEKAFGTSDIDKITEIILKKGIINLTTEQKRKKVEEKKKQIVALIAREAIDPRTNAPHPVARIEEALEKAKVQIDPFRDARDQLPEILKEIKFILPIKIEKVKVEVKIPSSFAHRSYGVLKSWGIIKEEWLNDGSLKVVIELPAGAQGEFYERLNKLTSGQNETRIIKDN